MTDRYHKPLAKILFDTEIYLKVPSATRLGREFTVYIDPMGAPGQVNARNYGPNYYVVISPGISSSLKMDQIRHTYLHYLLDPMAMKYPTAMKRLEPLLPMVKTAPMDESFKKRRLAAGHRMLYPGDRTAHDHGKVRRMQNGSEQSRIRRSRDLS